MKKNNPLGYRMMGNLLGIILVSTSHVQEAGRVSGLEVINPQLNNPLNSNFDFCDLFKIYRNELMKIKKTFTRQYIQQFRSQNYVKEGKII